MHVWHLVVSFTSKVIVCLSRSSLITKVLCKKSFMHNSDLILKMFVHKLKFLVSTLESTKKMHFSVPHPQQKKVIVRYTKFPMIHHERLIDRLFCRTVRGKFEDYLTCGRFHLQNHSMFSHKHILTHKKL